MSAITPPTPPIPTRPCPRCGGALKFRLAARRYRCEVCGYLPTADELSALDLDDAPAPHSPEPEETLEQAMARVKAKGPRPSVNITHRGPVEPRARAAFDTGQDYLWRENPAEAIRAFERAIEIQHDFADAHLWIARTSADPAVQRDHLSDILAYDSGHLEALRMLMVLNGRLTPEQVERTHHYDDPALQAADGPQHTSSEALLCPVCGGHLTEDAVTGQIECRFCGHVLPPDRGRSALQGADVLGMALIERKAQPVQWLVGERILHCNRCGADRTIPATVLSGQCPFCGSTHVIQQDALGTIEGPDGLIPFRISEAQADQILRARLGSVGERVSGWFVENRVQRAALEGAYLPFWIFDALLEVSKTIIDRRSSREDIRRIRPYQNYRFNEALTGIAIPAVSSPPPALARELGDYDQSAMIAYEPKLLARYPASLYTLDFSAASLEARSAASQQMRQLHGEGAGRDVDVNVFTSVIQMSFMLVLMPVWVATLTERDGDLRLALINGQTGRIALGRAQKPAD